MIDAEKAEFVKLLVGLAAVKPGKGLTPEGIEVWWLTLSPKWTLDEFRQAVTHLNESSEFMPSAYHFEQLRKAGRQTAGEAWAYALDVVRHGRYPTDDEHIERVVRAVGGWKVLAMTTDESLPFIERRFCEHFDAIQDADDVREAVPQIAVPRLPRAPLSAGFLLAKLVRDSEAQP